MPLTLSLRALEMKTPQVRLDSREATAGGSMPSYLAISGGQWSIDTGTAGGDYDYDAFGNLFVRDGQGQWTLAFEAETGELVDGVELADLPRFAFAGRELDGETGLHHNRHRTYDPATGRFLSQDPLGFAAGDDNLYRYAGNGPTNYTDPLGLAKWDAKHGGAVAGQPLAPTTSWPASFSPGYFGGSSTGTIASLSGLSPGTGLSSSFSLGSSGGMGLSAGYQLGAYQLGLTSTNPLTSGLFPGGGSLSSAYAAKLPASLNSLAPSPWLSARAAAGNPVSISAAVDSVFYNPHVDVGTGYLEDLRALAGLPRMVKDGIAGTAKEAMLIGGYFLWLVGEDTLANESAIHGWSTGAYADGRSIPVAAVVDAGHGAWEWGKALGSSHPETARDAWLGVSASSLAGAATGGMARPVGVRPVGAPGAARTATTPAPAQAGMWQANAASHMPTQFRMGGVDFSTHLPQPLTRGGAGPVRMGQAGEAVAARMYGVGRNTQRFHVNGRNRVPDFVLAQDINTRTPTIIVEAKNVRYQAFTRQLRDDVRLAGPYGTVYVAVPPGARVSGPLQSAFDDPFHPLNRVDLIVVP